MRNSIQIKKEWKLTFLNDDIIFHETETEEDSFENIIESDFVWEVEFGPDEPGINFHSEAFS